MPRHKNHGWFCTHDAQCTVSGDVQGRLTNLVYVLIGGYRITVFTCRQTKTFAQACTHTHTHTHTHMHSLSLFLSYTRTLSLIHTHTHTKGEKRRNRTRKRWITVDVCGGGKKRCTDHS